MIKTGLASLAKCSRVSLRCNAAASTAIYRSYSTAVEFELFKENSLKSLVQDIYTSLPKQGIEEPTKVKLILNLLRMYETKEDDWNQYATRVPNQSYTRNLVEHIHGHSKLLVLVWEPGKGSKIHSHPNTDCFVKILKGNLQEDLYDPESTSSKNQPILKRSTTLPHNSVAYISDAIGTHQITNKTNDLAVSLHLYVPQDKKLGLPIGDSHVAPEVKT